MRTRRIVVCVAVLVACDSEAPNSVPEEKPALVEMDIEITRSYKFRELKRARDDLVLLQGPGGSDYAREWGMTRDEGIATVRQAIRYWSQALGPVPQDGASDTLRLGQGGSGPGQGDSGIGALEEEGYACWWWWLRNEGDADDVGWWVCELAEY